MFFSTAAGAGPHPTASAIMRIWWTSRKRELRDRRKTFDMPRTRKGDPGQEHRPRPVALLSAVPL